MAIFITITGKIKKMLKHLNIIILALISLTCFIGCTPNKQKPDQPPQTAIETKNIITDINEPKQIPITPVTPVIEPNQQRPLNNRLQKTAPDVLETIQTEPNEPNELKISKLEPNEPNDSNTPRKCTFHEKSAYILKTYVDSLGLVNYETLKRKRIELRELLKEFAALDPNEYKSWPKEDKIAFWINAYNIHLLNIIIENYPIESDALSRFFYWPPDSVRYIDRKVGGIEKQKFFIMNEQFTLKEIEERFFHKQFNEPKAFFALFHGGLSGPALLNKPYYGKTLYQQLEKQIKNTLAHPESFNINYERKTVYIHAILQPISWYGNYFLEEYKTDKRFKDQRPAVRAVLNFLTNYLTEQQISFLELQNYTVKFTNYNWRLNERK